MTDDAIHSTQYYIKYINRAILTNLQLRVRFFDLFSKETQNPFSDSFRFNLESSLGFS